MWIAAALAATIAVALASMRSPATIPPERLSDLLEQQRQTFAREVSTARDRERTAAGAPHMRTIVRVLRHELVAPPR